MKPWKTLFFIITFCMGFNSWGQYQSVTIGIDGLTCSLCSNNVEKMLRQLSFIEKVEMDLNELKASITFFPNQKVEINKIAQKVIDAGYSLRYLKATFYFNSLLANNNVTFHFEDNLYTFINVKEKFLNGWCEIQFIGKKYLSKKEYKNWSAIIPSEKNNKNTISYFITF